LRKQTGRHRHREEFKKPFSGLNGTNMPGAARAYIIRSLIEVG
jgi:hypothetical protein